MGSFDYLCVIKLRFREPLFKNQGALHPTHPPTEGDKCNRDEKKNFSKIITSSFNYLYVIKLRFREPLFKLFAPILDGVHGAEDQDVLDLVGEVLHDRVDQADGLKRFAQAHAVSKNCTTWNSVFENILGHKVIK